MSNRKVMTAPLAVIKSKGGQPIGKMKNIRISESIRRGKVMSLGNMIPDELPPLEWSGTLSCGFYTIDFKESAIAGALLRKVGNNVQAFIDTLLLDEEGIQITIYRRVKDTTNPNGIITSKLEEFATISSAFPNRESFDISEANISGRDVDFDYLTPILYDL